MRKVMEMAWNFARNGAKEHGGKPSEYIAESMKMAHQVNKQMKEAGFKNITTVEVIGEEAFFNIKQNGETVYSGKTQLQSYGMLMQQYKKEYKIEAIEILIDGKCAGYQAA